MGDHIESVDQSAAGGSFSSAAAGGDYHQMEQHQQSGGGGGGGNEYNAEVNLQWEPDSPQQQQAGPPPQYYQQNNQPPPGNYQTPAYNPNVAPGVPPPYYPPQTAPPSYKPKPAAGGPPTYPPPQQSAGYQPTAPPPQQGVYPPNGAAPAYTPQGTPSHPGQGAAYAQQTGAPAAPQQVFTPVRLPPGMPGSNFGAGAIIRPEIGPPVAWTTELFGFLEDCYGCPLVIIAPCITFGQIAEITDTGYNKCQTAGIIYAIALFLGIPCLYSYTYRTKMRHKFNLREDPLDDFCTHFWCEFCALAQEYRELRYRGIDPSLGYDLQQALVNQAMAAPVPPRMAK
ncbi:hypothetical protein Mapa_017501 [Marchantia paleacea]|nr:hypothetical protein Mapa_017501 [Marchantia paleacea]